MIRSSVTDEIQWSEGSPQTDLECVRPDVRAMPTFHRVRNSRANHFNARRAPSATSKDTSALATCSMAAPLLPGGVYRRRDLQGVRWLLKILSARGFVARVCLKPLHIHLIADTRVIGRRQ